MNRWRGISQNFSVCEILLFSTVSKFGSHIFRSTHNKHVTTCLRAPDINIYCEFKIYLGDLCQHCHIVYMMHVYTVHTKKYTQGSPFVVLSYSQAPVVFTHIHGAYTIGRHLRTLWALCWVCLCLSTSLIFIISPNLTSMARGQSNGCPRASEKILALWVNLSGEFI